MEDALTITQGPIWKGRKPGQFPLDRTDNKETQTLSEGCICPGIVPPAPRLREDLGAPSCSVCGAITTKQRDNSYRCVSCGHTEKPASAH